MMVRRALNTRGGGKLSTALRLSACATTMSVLAAFAQAPNCTLITVPDTDEWRDWKVESIAGVTDEGVAAGTLVYTGNDTNVRVRKRIFRWNRADERITIFDPPVNDNEANLVTGVEALDFSVDGTAIAGRITYQGRPSAAFVFRGGLGYRILKQRRALGQTTTGLALSGRAVGYKGYHLAVQPSNDSAFVVPDPFGGSSSLNLRCGMSLPERIPVRVQRCTWSPLQGQNEIAEPDPTDDIDDTLEFMWIDEQGTVSAFILRGRDLFGPGWIPPWSGGGDQNVRGNERFHVMDISPDGSMVVGSMEVLRGGCYITSSGYVFQLDRGEYVMKAERLVVGFPDYGGYAYLAEFKPFFEEQPIRGRATCMAGYYWGNYDWTDDMCYANYCRVVAGVLHPYGGRSGRVFTWFSWGTGGNDADYSTFYANGQHWEFDPVQVSKVSGVSADESLLLLGHRRFQPSIQGYTGSLSYLDWYNLWNPLPAPSKCVDTFAMSPAGRFTAVKYEDGQCLSGAAVIELGISFLQNPPDEVVVALRNLTDANRSVPYVGDDVEVRAFVRFGNRWYTRDCPDINSVRRGAWFRPGTRGRTSRGGQQLGGEAVPTPLDGNDSFNNNLNTNLIRFNSASNAEMMPNAWRFDISWISLTHRCTSSWVEGEERRRRYGYTVQIIQRGQGTDDVSPIRSFAFRTHTDRTNLTSQPGTRRIRCTITYEVWNPETRRYENRSLSSTGPSRNGEVSEESHLATRLSVRQQSPINDVRQSSLPDYVRWATSFVDVPYAMGDGWYGGRASLTHYDRSPNSGEDGFGIDCNALVCASLNLAGTTWTRIPASSYRNDRYSEAVTLENLQIGDVFVGSGHIFIVYDVRNRRRNSVEIRALDAYGPWNRARISDWITVTWEEETNSFEFSADYEEGSYVPRRLRTN